MSPESLTARGARLHRQLDVIAELGCPVNDSPAAPFYLEALEALKAFEARVGQIVRTVREALATGPVEKS